MGPIEKAYMEHIAKKNLNHEDDYLEPIEDVVNKPSHYHKGGIDVIGFAERHYSKEELKGFYRINIIKYVDRYDKKNGLTDLDKADFYLKKLWELESNE